MSFHLLTKLSRDLMQLFDTSAFYDVIIRVGQGDNLKEFPAHSLILRARSSWFQNQLSSKTVKASYDKIILSNSNISPPIFEIILNGKVDLLNCSGIECFDLLFAAEELKLIELLEHIQENLIHRQTEWMDRNFITYHEKIYNHESLQKLQIHYTSKIAYNPLSIFESPTSFSPNILTSLDYCEYIKLNESLWGFIVNWARFQIPKLGNQVSGWNKKDWNEFKYTLSQCIPWNSIMSMNWNEFHDLLIPCEPFLPADKFDVALRHQLKNACGSSTVITSPISTQFNNTILNICHATLLTSWIDRKDDIMYRPAEIPYEFRLVLRGQRDGFSPDLFHQRCGNIQKTVVVFKINNSTAIYGGYNPLDWKFDRATNDSFIFEFDNGKADFVRLGRFAIHKKSGYGPCFGDDDLLAFPDGKRSIYWKSANSSNLVFQVVDYEVYQIVDKLRKSNFTSTTHVYSHKKR
ncbi:4574_t:CDS:2 [Funneliformis mosseae]|uniref:4574_t:CDS:1 n=1 Tax=Funneliformis mosseae TaxID=27381 RepID=A0A9N9A3P9_FUNMO|nr:4574_t:CDS:2 [Funneliformis mosseae]